MAYHLFSLKTLLGVYNESKLLPSVDDDAAKSHHRDGRISSSPTHTITRCAFHQSDQTSVSVLVRSDHFITLVVEEFGEESKTRSIQWFLSPSKTVKSVCLIHSCTWALLVTEDASLYILPVLPLIDPDKCLSSASCGYSIDDITFIILKGQTHTRPTSVTCWRSLYKKCDIALVGSEEGEVIFVDLDAKQEIRRIRIGDAVVKLDVVHHLKSLTYLLILTASNNQFGLLLEQTNSRAGSMTNSLEVEAATLDFTLVRRSETVHSILGPETTDHPFRPLRFDQFMRTVQLSKQVVKGNTFIVAHCLSSNILKVYDSSLDSWLPIYVYGIPISSERVLLTDSFIFIMSKVKKQELTSVTVLSSMLSEASKTDRDRLSSDAKLQTIVLPVGEEVIGVYRQVHPDARNAEVDGSTNQSTSCNKNSTREQALVEGCIIFTKRAVYQIKPQVGFVDLFLELTAEGSTKKAEILGMTLDLNMSSLYLRAAEEKLRQSHLPEAIKLFRLSRGSTVTWACLLAKFGYIKESLSVVEGALGKQGEVSNSDCRKLADIAVKCLVYLHMTAEANHQRLSLLNLEAFLADNLDYDEHAAVTLLCEFRLWDSMLEMSKTRGILEVAMTTLLNNWPDPLDVSLLKKLKSKTFLGAFVSAGNGAFVEKLPTPETAALISSRPQLVFRHMSFIREHVCQMSVQQLLQVAVLMDPTKPGVRQLFEIPHGRQRSLSLSSVASIDSCYGLEPSPETVVLPEASSLVEVFVSVLIELVHRRCQQGYDLSTEPSLAEIDNNYCDGKEEVHVRISNSDIRRNLIACGEHHSCLISSGELYTWGKATCGRLGHGSIIPLEGCSLPTRVETLQMHHQQIVTVACGSRHTLALTSTGRLYAWGDSTYGQVGCGDRKTRTHPSVVEELQGKGCVEIACGNYHCLARTQSNRVWSWGWGVHGQLGHRDIEDQLSPKVIGTLLSKDIAQIGAGACHSGVLDTDGKAWMFGSGAFGQLGAEGISKSSVPLLLVSLANHTIKNLVCGYYHNLAMTDSEPQKLFIWGKSPSEIRNNLQASRKLKAHLKKSKKPHAGVLSKPQGPHSQPRLVETEHILSPIKKIVAAYTHNLLLTANGSLYAWGRNDMDQLGDPTNNHKRHVDTPSPVMAAQTFADVGAGLSFSAAVSHYGVVYTWGSAEMDQLGYNLQPHVSLVPPSTHLTVSSPRKVPGVPLITIPAELLQSYDKGEELEESFSEDTRGLLVGSMSTTIIDQLLSSLPVPSLSLPSSDPDQPPYDRPSLLAVLQHLSEYYQLPEVLAQCGRSGMWALATQIHLLNGDFDQALLSSLSEVQQGKEEGLSLDEAISCLHGFFCMLSQKISLVDKEEQHRSLQLVLSEVFLVWHRHGFPMDEIESLLQRHLRLLAYPLSLLLFCSKSSSAASGISPFPPAVQASLSVEFCLQVTSAAMGTIEDENCHGMSNEIPTHSYHDDPATDSTKEVLTRSGSVELDTEFIRSNSWFGREGLIITADALNPELDSGLPSHMAGDNPVKVVAFTCGHCFERTSFYNKELPKISDKFGSYPGKTSESCNILTCLYEIESGQIPAACPQCSLESLVI